MKIVFGKNRVSFEAGAGIANLADSKVKEVLVKAMRERERSIPLPIYFGNERKHTGIYG